MNLSNTHDKPLNTPFFKFHNFACVTLTLLHTGRCHQRMKYIRFEFNNEFHKNVFRLCLIVKTEYMHNIELLVHVLKQLFLYVLYVLDWLQIILNEGSWSTGVSGYNGVNSCFTVKSLFYDSFSPLSMLKINTLWMYVFHLNDLKLCPFSLSDFL